MLDAVLRAYGLKENDFRITPLTSGHIHKTFKLEGDPAFVLQRVNKNVFKHPEFIAENLRVASDFLHEHYPAYTFLSTVTTIGGDEMVYDTEGFPWRLFPYLSNTITVDAVNTDIEAFRASAAFGGLAMRLNGVDTTLFKPTIERFHDLGLRYQQFLEALGHAGADRLTASAAIVSKAQEYSVLVDRYQQLTSSGQLHPRITHNDTKINNVLFDSAMGETICVIDLDTLMPGYFIYDLGDMIRTFVSPVSEEEGDLAKISFREDIHAALIEGYLSEMDAVLSPEERSAIPFAGLMMTYIMALRMLTDFLNGDVYYHTTYAGQNLVRAKNQFRLLDILVQRFG